MNVAEVALPVALVLLYFLPGLIARFRHHRNMNAIAITNLLFGRTVLGWGIALIWAAKND
ncbi:superinfection immunity protein [Burkholderia sp. JPY481]